MNTVPWMKQTTKQAMLDRCLKSRSGMMGYLASFHSFKKKRDTVKRPKKIRQITVAERQGCDTPPYSRPSKNITVPLEIVTTPVQSIALSPAIIGVLGISISRRKRIMAKARPSKGTIEVSLSNGMFQACHTVDVETPSPGDLLCKDTTKYGA